MGNKRFMAGVQEVLAERYELLEVLGRGGMGVVYRARDRLLDRIVAVKVLPLDRAQDPTSVARFEREALAAAGLSHRNIVAVFDSGADQQTRFIVMEYLPGQSLAELLHERGALSATEAVEVGAQVAAALAAAHQAGIVHRDIKPANVMVDEQRHVKVLDFGIARLTAGISLTQTAAVLGSAPYLAPELCRGAPADARSDIYALGCVIYELLTGQPPFTGELPAAIVHQQISAIPRTPEELNPAIPPALGAMTLAMLAKDPDRRPQHARDLVTSLPRALEGPAAAEETARMPVLEAATTEMAADGAPTVPVASAGAAAGADPTRVMPVSSGSGLRNVRTYALIAGICALALAIALLVFTSDAGAPGRAASKHRRSGAQTARKHAAMTTSAVTRSPSVTTTTPGRGGTSPQQAPPALVPAGHKPGGQHAGGPHAGGPHAGGPHAGGPHAGGPHAGGPHAGGPHAGGPHAGGLPPGKAK